jgi:Ca-activated chloride channel family protein
MSFINSHYFIHIILSTIVISCIFIFYNRSFFKWIKTYWFYEQTWLSKFSNLLYYISILLFLLSLLDLRGPEKKIKGALPDQRTIIVLDSSLSMLCEDVRPSRFIKAIQLARHFVKNSAGHQIAIVIFSDTQKRILPFTDDIDLVDSRLAALEKTNAIGGGSSIAQAVSEAAGYFETDGDEGKDSTGNILLFTDAEEGDGDFKISLPNNINLAVVGVGTASGGNIPIRWEDGSFKGYKMKKNDPVVTKLDESFIKSLGKNVKSFSYWIANSYSLPTDEILNFFRGTYNKAHSAGDMRVRPVYSHYILIPAVLFYALSIIIGRFATFRLLSLVLLFCLGINVSRTSVAYAEE